MSMSHPEPPSSTIHGELRGRIIGPPPMPPPPPLPPPGAGIELLRDTVEVQARTIRYLLSNYEALLRKVGHDERFKTTIEYNVGADKSFAANAQIPKGWWVVISAGSGEGSSHSFHWDHGGSSHSTDLTQGEVLFSNGTHHHTSSTPKVLAPIESELKTVEIDNGE